MSASLLVVRSATRADLTAIEALLAEAALPTVGVAELLASVPEDVVVVTDRDAVVAVAGLEACDAAALLRSVVVRATHRGEGLGERVVRAALDRARGRGFREVWLLTTTAADWFPRFGFVPADRATAPAGIAATDEFRSACPASAACLRLVLASAATP